MCTQILYRYYPPSWFYFSQNAFGNLFSFLLCNHCLQLRPCWIISTLWLCELLFNILHALEWWLQEFHTWMPLNLVSGCILSMGHLKGMEEWEERALGYILLNSIFQVIKPPYLLHLLANGHNSFQLAFLIEPLSLGVHSFINLFIHTLIVLWCSLLPNALVTFPVVIKYSDKSNCME